MDEPLRLVAATRLRPISASGRKLVADEDSLVNSPVSGQLAAWAAAWSSGRIDSYLGFYAPSFIAADGSKREEWAKHREPRVAGRAGNQVEVSDIRVRFAAPNVLESEFKQNYRADGYRDSTRKVLRWIKVGSEWLIDREMTRTPRRDVAALKDRQ